jgi:hypothetical protein
MMEPSAPVSNTAFQMGNALGVAIVSMMAFSRTDDVLATDPGTNPLVALTEGFRSGFLACALLAGIGMALALLLLGRPRRAPEEQVELEPSPAPAGHERHRF